MTGIFDPTNPHKPALAAAERLEELLRSSQQDPFLYRALRIANHVVVRSGILSSNSDAHRGTSERDKAERLQNYGFEKKKADDTQLN
tara:strand:+ start:500 stop:760 length:261 start_codon:yes stop_codon:yes gene_type:complete